MLMTVTAVLAAVGILLPFRPTVVLGHSMAPTMRSGGLYMVNTRYYQSHPIRRGDVVVFHYRGETCTKRVYALPGERVLLLQYDDGEIYASPIDGVVVMPVQKSKVGEEWIFFAVPEAA